MVTGGNPRTHALMALRIKLHSQPDTGGNQFPFSCAVDCAIADEWIEAISQIVEIFGVI